MAIPENQLKIWAQPGTVMGAKNTHAAIRKALAQHQWPDHVRYVTYLQGSYRNNTHLRRQSDVDVVVELTSLPVRDGSRLSDSQRRLLDKDFPEPAYGWRRFRGDVRSAIAGSLGDSRVREGKKTFKLVMESPEIPVDVVVAVRYLTYTEYSGQRSYKCTEGLGLYLPAEGRWAVNYPHLHRRNGVSTTTLEPNPLGRCSGFAARRFWFNLPPTSWKATITPAAGERPMGRSSCVGNSAIDAQRHRQSSPPARVSPRP